MTMITDEEKNANAKPNPDSDLMPDHPSSFDASACLAEELMKMSFTDRNQIEEEIHGVGSRSVTETPELIERSLAQFDFELNARRERDSIKTKKLLRNVIRITPKFTSATSQSASEAASASASASPKSSCYLNDPAVRLRFLRCELFIVGKAVQRIINNLEFMRELFGDFVLERPVTLSDFSREEETALMNSRIQYLPFRDRSGRRILCGVGNLNYHIDPRLRYKFSMLLHWYSSEDVETQKKGIVMVLYLFDETSNSWEKSLRPTIKEDVASYHKKQNSSIPVRITSLQWYSPDKPLFRFLWALYIYKQRDSPLRFLKAHFGVQTEILYKMSSYGVPVELIPVSSTGSLKFSNQCAWVNVLRTKEMSPKDLIGKEIVECPRSCDVVFRQGNSYTKKQAGNENYRELLAFYSNDHFGGDKNKKYKITKLIIEQIESQGGRFLEWENKRNTWLVLTDVGNMRKRIAAAFRQRNRSRGGESKKLDKTIENVNCIISADRDSPEPIANSPLQEYYSIDHQSKRQKTTGCGHFCDNKSVFGKCFNPIDAKSDKSYFL